MKVIKEAKEIKESKKLKESFEGQEVFNDLFDRAKLNLEEDSEEGIDEAVHEAIDEGLIYNADILNLAYDYGVIDYGELVEKMYDELYGDLYRKVEEYLEEEKDESLTESKQINEGPGAGYSIVSTNYFVDGTVTNYTRDEDGTDYRYHCTVDMTGTCGGVIAESYYYGTEELQNVPIKVTDVEIWVDKNYVDENGFTDEELKDEIISVLKGSSYELNYGGGWSHVTYDGQLTDDGYLETHSSGEATASVYITDEETIDYIDRAVSGDTRYETYSVWDSEGVVDEFDEEDEAREYANENDDIVKITHDYWVDFKEGSDIEHSEIIWKSIRKN